MVFVLSSAIGALLRVLSSKQYIRRANSPVEAEAVRRRRQERNKIAAGEGTHFSYTELGLKSGASSGGGQGSPVLQLMSLSWLGYSLLQKVCVRSE